MKNINKYGFYSGGYIADRIDRYALRMLNNSYPETKNELWFTRACDITYKKQLCDTDATYLRTIAFNKMNDSTTVGVELVQGDTLIAIGYVVFAKAKGDFCKIKKKKIAKILSKKAKKRAK